MKGIALLLLCAFALVQADQPQRSRSGKICICHSDEAASTCSKYGSEGHLIVHENCNQFYKCSNGQAVPYFCPSNLLYNSLNNICDWPFNVECGHRPIVEESDCGEESEENDQSSNQSDSSDSVSSEVPDNGNNGGTCNCNPGEAPGICSADGSNGILVAHENCNQFYTCDNGVPVAVICPSGLLYNPFTEQCDWAHKVECGDKPIVEIDDGGNNGGEEDCSEESNNGNGENGSGSGNQNGTDSGSGPDNGGTCNCNPGEAPGICAADGSEGTLVAHENCNQFYKCAHGAPVTVSCPAGLVYNPYIECCDWPYNFECGDKPIVDIGDGNNGESGSGNGNGDNGNGNGNGDNGSGNGNGDSGTGGGTCNCNPGEAPGICAADGSEGTLVAHENCNQFYKCAHGAPVTVSCPAGLVYNPYIECCDWPYNVKCGDRPIVDIGGGNNGDSGTGNGNGDNGNGNGNGDNGNGDNGNGDSGTGGGTCNCNPGEAPGICAADGSEGTLVAHENCNQFYKCAHGAPVTVSCPAGLVYNPYIECCDWPYNVKCGDRPIVDIGGGNNGDSGTGNGNGDNGNGDGNGDNGNGDNGNGDSGTGGGTCNCNPGEAPGICAADGSEGALVAHENCNQFYKCVHGAPVTVSCPAGLVYNPYIECCDWPYNVKCGDKPIVDIGGGNNGDSGSGNGSGDNGNGDNGNGNGNGDNGSGNGNGDSATGGGTCNCNPGEAPGICAADGSEGTLVAHENCNQFYKCAHGAPVTVSCPAGLVYNPYIECCDWPYNVKCGDRPIVDIGGGNNGDSGTGNGNGDNGNGDGNGDNGNGDNGNGDSGTGGGTCNCNPGEAPGICAADGSEGALVAHENCNQFYKCVHGAPVTVSCPAGLVYNPYIECCDWPYNVKCGDKPIVDIGGGNNGDSGSGNGSGDNGNGDNGNGNGNGDNGSGNGNGDSATGGGTCNCNPGEAPGICAADGSEGTLVAHENCNQFYKCDHGAPVTVSCPAGLVYNPYIECCDWPYNVECGDRPIVDIGGGNNGDNGTGNGNGDNGNGNGNGDNGNGDSGTGGGTCNCNPGEASGICAADGSEGTLVANENCNQFYKCVHGAPVTVSCPAGLVYNPYIECCDWPYNVECEDKPIVDIGGGNNGDNGSGNGNGDNGSGNGNGDNGSGNGNDDNGNGDNGTGGGTCNCNPGEAPGICAADGSEGTLVAHENCNQFYKCDHGAPVTVSCPAGLVYNPYIECCDWPYNVECGDRPIVDIGGGNNGDNGTGNGNGDNGNGNGNGDNGNGDSGTGGGTCNCNPGEASGICAADGSEGTLVANENCNQFYKCVHGAPVTVSCPAGLVYNPYIECCDWPYNVECEDRPIVDIGGGNNGDNGSDNGNGDNGSGNGNGDNGNGDNGTGGGTCNCNPGEAPGICAADGSGGILIAHENCNQFYKCDHGVPVAVICQNGLLYNPYTEQCDWPENVDCGDKPIGGGNNGDNGSGNGNGNGDSGSGNGNGNGNGDNGNGDNGTDGGTCNCNPGEAPGICAADGSGGILIAHENCNQFYKCDHGVPVAFICQNGLLYNPYTEQCDWPQNVDCGDKPIGGGNNGDSGSGNGNGGNESGNGNGDNGSGNGNDNNGNGNENGDNGSGSGGNCNPSEAPVLCAASGSDGVLVAHENCNQFYKCSEGLPVALICPSNLLYNPTTEQCDWPENVDCGDRVIPNNNTDSNNGGNGDTGNNGNEIGSGNGEGGGTCNCNPGEAPAICATGHSEGVLIANEECNKFYKCSFGNPVAFTCPNNLLYNPFIEVCDWPWNVECGERVISEAGGNNGGDNGGDNGGNDNDNENGDTGGNCDPSQAPAICAANGSNGVLVANENCDQYYVCSNGAPVALNCPTNLLYNPSTEQCDWPRNVDCGDRVVPVPEPESDSGACFCNPRQAPSVCASSDSDGKMIAHAACDQYYVCFNGNPIARSCPRSLFYDPQTKQCNWPAAVSCEGRHVAIPFSLNKHMQARRGYF